MRRQANNTESRTQGNMRIIAGEFRSRRLKSIPGLDTRPTPDRMRESLFSIIQHEMQGSVFADLYAGTGSVGLEALSRGASSVIFVERAPKAARVLRENIAAMGAETRTRLSMEPARRVAENLSADIVFLDPPYELTDEYGDCLDLLSRRPVQLVLAQHETRLKLAERYGKLARVRTLKQGDNTVSFYRPAEEEDAAVPDAASGDD